VVPNIHVAAKGTREQEEAEKDARERTNSEGSVVYGLDGPRGNVICMYKWKNVWVCQVLGVGVV
jgi:hypothetical protein